MNILFLCIACIQEETIPTGDWANIAPAQAREVRPSGAHQLVSLEEGPWSFWARLPADPAVHVGDTLLLGRGLTVDVEDAPRGDVLAIDDFAVVSPEVAARALTIPDLPEDRVPIATLHAEREARHGTPVRAAGRIVKASMDVFDTNWYHLRDGTGDADEGTDDLTFTSPAVLGVGDLVVASGPLTADKDLGFGYFYPVILEGAAVTALDGRPIASRSEAATTPVAPRRTSMRPAPHVPAPAVPDAVQGSVAPGDRVVHGLTLGTDDDGAVDAWAEGLSCDRSPALARKTVHTRCEGTSPHWPSLGSPRVQTLIARAEDASTIHHVSAARTHANVSDATADYLDVLTRMSVRLGEPLRSTRPSSEDPLTGRFAYTTTWRFEDLEAGLSLMRTTPDGPVLVRERWFVPGAEAAAGDRGVGVHGAGTRSAPNPHLAPSGATTPERIQ